MELAILAFLAGVLTVAAPCILPLLPVVVGGSLAAFKGESVRYQRIRPLVITASLAVSVLVFSLLLKASTVLLGVPQEVWNVVAGGIVLLFGVYLLFPAVWEQAAGKSGLQAKTNELLGRTTQNHNGVARDVLMGAALGPVFSSCSPTYALIVAVVLPASFAEGFVYLVLYALGLASILLLIAYLGQSVTKRLGWAANPHGWFRRIVGLLFVIVGVMVLTGLDRDFQTYVLDQGWYDPIMKLEDSLKL